MPRPPAVHGSRSKYRAGCHCPPCTAANARYITAWRRRRGYSPPAASPPPHGTLWRYKGYECRCLLCTAANTAACARARAARRARRGAA